VDDRREKVNEARIRAGLSPLPDIAEAKLAAAAQQQAAEESSEEGGTP